MGKQRVSSNTKFVRWMGPILDALRELGGAASAKQVEEFIARSYDVETPELATVLKSGQTRFYNHLHWARLYLTYEKLIECPKAGQWQLTKSGREQHLRDEDALAIHRKWSRQFAASRKQATRESKNGEAESGHEKNSSTSQARWMGQTLEALKQLGGSGSPNQVEECIAKANGFENSAELIKSGEVRFKNEVAWGRQYLVYEGLLVDPQKVSQKRGRWTLTERGWKTSLTTDESIEILRHWRKWTAERRKARREETLEGSSKSNPQSNDAADGVTSSITRQPRAPYGLAECSAETGVPEATLRRWIKAIERKGQAVLYGPPGTGKTYLAERLARHLSHEADGLSDLVQFHPAYSYEEFVQGIRPQTRSDGQLEYSVRAGRFLEFCHEAQQRSGRCVLIVDEINRANLSRVFGELMFLLEYRDREIPLAGGGRFRIPSNVRIIGTMNTADRSIALVDHALRRRFAFIGLQPDLDVLRKYHQSSSFNVAPLIDLLLKVNRQIGDRHYELGISFFMRSDLGDQLEDIWRMEIEPYLEEVFFDHEAKLNELRWNRIKDEVLS